MAVVAAGGEPRRAQHGGHVRERHRVVLRRERVDRRRDDRQLGLIQPLPHVAGLREDVGVAPARRTGSGSARPRARGRWAGLIPTCERQITAAPVSSIRGIIPAVCGSCSNTTSDARTRAASSSALASRATFVGHALLVAERPAVAVVSVQPVVQALGDAEELRGAVDHDPARVAAAAARVADQRAQHLGDAATMSRRVDVPEDPRGEQLTAPRERVLEGWRGRRR